MSPKTLPIVLVIVAYAGSASAQQTNVEVLGDLAVRCLGGVPGAVDTFQLFPGPRMPYLRPFLTQYWLQQGYTVVIGDSSRGASPDALHQLRYEPQAAAVRYDRVGSDSLQRTVDLSLSHSFTSPRGLLLGSAHCSDSVSDVVAVDAVRRLQLDPWDETRGSIPIDRGWRSWAEPVVIGSSIAIVVYLFFSVRS